MVKNSIVYWIFMHLMLIENLHSHLTCPNDLIPCANKTHCIRIEQVCTEYRDCLDQQGQHICHYCPRKGKNRIACLTSIEPNLSFDCLSSNQICDSHRDCIDNFDESQCGKEKCKNDSWLCENGSCIEKKYLCDGEAQCLDGSDEGDFCRSYPCGSDHIRCPTGECISTSKKCDGIAHCSDAFDEKDCPRPTLKTVEESCSIVTNTFQCSADFHRICISNDRICDGFIDCPMGDDEHNCNKTCTSKSICPNDPNIQCIQHSTLDQICRCKQLGYKLTSTTSRCQDVDECHDSLDNLCSYTCTNTDGSFDCTCPIGYTIDPETKTCRNINDATKRNLFILSDNNMKFSNIKSSNPTHYSFNILQTMNTPSHQQISHIQYDPYQNLIIYSDQTHRNLYCKSILTSQILLLISNVTIQTFTYNIIDKSLFLIDIDSQTLRLYTPITCDSSEDIQMHLWNINDRFDQIHSMDIDLEHRQLIFASRFKFFLSNFSQPNQTETIYSTDRDIKRFIYQSSFKRLFWTTISQTNENSFPVYTCDQQFRDCHDTFIVLPYAWPFAFFDDGLIYESLSNKSVEYVQIFGQNRFSKTFISSIKDNIRSLSIIDYPEMISSNLCMKNSSKRLCLNQICLQINSTNISCLTIDQKLLASHRSMSIESNYNSQLSIDNEILSETEKQRNNFRYRPRNTILFFIMAIGLVAIVLTFIAKRCYKNFSRKNFDIEQRRDNNDRLPLTSQLNY